MCGILGMAGPPGTALDLAAFRRALTAIRHRGPDDEGFLLVQGAERAQPAGGSDTPAEAGLPGIDAFLGQPFDLVLGHRRLSILDLSPAGHQPMAGPGGDEWIVFNGEIYNYLELREELARLGHAFHTGTDTEVILAAYRQWGHAMLGRFVGMFAFALFDRRRRTLLLARDFFGIKPLYYTRAGGQFAFASEVKALLELGNVPRHGHAASLFRYLRYGFTDAGSDTLFSAIQQLPAAHYAELDLARPTAVEPVRYWHIDLAHRSDVSFPDATAEVRRLLSDSVRLHMRSDVPVGSCLSGGLDSTALVMLARQALAPGQAQHAFSFIADDPIWGEEKYVDLATDAAQLVTHKVRPTPADILDDLDALMRTQEFPFGSTSVYAQFRVFRLAHEAGIKVMLDGQGSDEIFGGYNSAISARLAGSLARGRLLDALALVRGTRVLGRGYLTRLILSALGRLPPSFLVAPLQRLAGEPLLPPWVDGAWFSARGVVPRPRDWGRGHDALRQELLYSLESDSLPQLLRYEDRNSMAFSIESRVPYCIPALASFALSLPPGHLIGGDGTTKAVLRHACRGIVPQVILDRPKVGFVTPEQDWLNALRPWVEKTITSPMARALPFLRESEARAFLLAGLQTKGRMSPAVWRVLDLVHWASLWQVTWE